MREALAHSDHDFVVAEHRRRRPQAKAPRRGIVWFAAALVRLMFRLAAYPNRILGGLVFAVVIAIAVNALLLQHSRHPAPLFHSVVATNAQAPAPQTSGTIVREPLAPVDPAPVPAPEPAPQPTNNDQIDQLLKTDAQPANGDANPQAANGDGIAHLLAAPTPQPANHDAIAHLLATPANHEAPHDSVVKESAAHDVPADERPKTILAVQHALVKLGYVVRADGEMGAVTRHALAQYERDHGLPADPHLTAKLLHRLSAETGMAMD